MHRFRVEEIQGDICALSKEEANHALKVLRMRVGDMCEISDGQRIFEGTLLENARIQVGRELPNRESCARITLYQGYPKADKLELIAQKFTELGGVEIVPVLTERSVARPDEFDKKKERFERIALEATKQTGRAAAPRIAPMLKFDAALAAFEKHELKILFWEDAEDTRLKDVLRMYPDARDIAYFIGPEGGLSAEEAGKIQKAGAVITTLGARILRAETAAVAGCALIQAMWGDI